MSLHARDGREMDGIFECPQWVDTVEKVCLPPSSPFTASARRKIFYERRLRLRSSVKRGAITEKASTLGPPVARGCRRSDFFNTIGGRADIASQLGLSHFNRHE